MAGRTPQELKVKLFKIKNSNDWYLRDNGFRCLSDHSTFYKYEFPAYCWKHRPVLFGDIVVNSENGEVDFELHDEAGTAYAPWYDDKYSTNNLVVKICDMNFRSKMKQLGIEEVKEVKESKEDAKQHIIKMPKRNKKKERFKK